MIDLTKKKILVTGGAGFLGSHIIKKLAERGVPAENISAPRSSECDMRILENCEKAMQGKDIVIHAAALTGNMEFHRENPGLVFYTNLMIGAQLIEAARTAKVEKVVSIGSVFEYPAAASLPYKECDVSSGPPAEVHRAYAYTKRMLVEQGVAYGKQYGLNSIHLIVPNMYGPGEKESAYVIPSLIRKILEAQKTSKGFIEMWGTGAPTREFLYAEDAAEGTILAAEKYDKREPVNLGSGSEVSIKDLTNMVVEIMQFKGEVRWDASKPEVHDRSLLDVSSAEKEFGFRANMDMQEGLKKTVEWYRSIL